MLQLWLNVLAGGVLTGIVYALVACGLTIVFGVMGIINFAHGEMVVAGMYIGYLGATSLGLSTLPAAILAAAVMFVFGYALQRWLVERFMTRPQHVQFILFIGLSLVITALHLMIFGADPRAAPSSLAFDVIELGPLHLDRARVEAALAAAALMAALVVFLRLSPFGQAVRAAADNRLGGLVIGLRIPRIFAVTAGLGAACAGAAGGLIAPIFDTQPFLAIDFTLIAFVVVIVGGLGSLSGALVGGVLIGLAEACAALLIDPAMKTAFSYALLVLVLLIRPNGLFGARTA